MKKRKVKRKMDEKMMDEEKNDIRSTADKLIKQRADRELQESKIIENMSEYAKALNGVASTPNGELFLKTLIKACGVFIVKEGVDGVALIENNAKRNLYLEFIRPYLETKFKQELEI